MDSNETNGKHCPNCRNDIGIWPVFSAGLPNRIWCPHCNQRLCYRMTIIEELLFMLAMVGIIFGLVLVISVFLPSFDESPEPYRLLVVGSLLISWVAVELVATWFLRNFRTLSPYESV